MTRFRALLGRAVVPGLALITAFAIGAVIIVITDFDHLSRVGSDPAAALGGAVDVVVRGYGAIITRAIGDPAKIAIALQTGGDADIARAIRPFTEALLFATPLIFVSLGIGIAFHAGLFNLGADGQFLIGALGATIAAVSFDGVLPAGTILVLALAAGGLFGAAYGFIPGVLKARTGAHEVITTLMLNTLAAQIVFYLSRNGGLSRNLPSITSVPRIFDLPTIRLDWGFMAALAMAAVVSFVIFRTPLGFELRATGHSRTVARYAGIGPGKAITLGMTLSGGIIGLGGAFLSLGPAGGLTGFGGDGFVALALALLGGLRPGGIVLAALVYAALNNGARVMVVETGVPLDLLIVVIALAVMFVAAPGVVRSMWRLRPAEASLDAGPYRPSGPAEPL